MAELFLVTQQDFNFNKIKLGHRRTFFTPRGHFYFNKIKLGHGRTFFGHSEVIFILIK